MAENVPAEAAEVPVEISVEEFLALSEAAPERGKVKLTRIFELISGKALPTSAIAKACGVTYSAMYTRLKKLAEKGTIQRRYKEGRAYWMKPA